MRGRLAAQRGAGPFRLDRWPPDGAWCRAMPLASASSSTRQRSCLRESLSLNAFSSSSLSLTGTDGASGSGGHSTRVQSSGLTAPANCRMCLVEIEMGGRRGMMPSCTQMPAEGMIVDTETDAVKANQNAVMEFLLINHPLDCPVCDQAGEC